MPTKYSVDVCWGTNVQIYSHHPMEAKAEGKWGVGKRFTHAMIWTSRVCHEWSIGNEYHGPGSCNKSFQKRSAGNPPKIRYLDNRNIHAQIYSRTDGISTIFENLTALQSTQYTIPVITKKPFNYWDHRSSTKLFPTYRERTERTHFGKQERIKIHPEIKHRKHEGMIKATSLRQGRQPTPGKSFSRRILQRIARFSLIHSALNRHVETW